MGTHLLNFSISSTFTEGPEETTEALRDSKPELKPTIIELVRTLLVTVVAARCLGVSSSGVSYSEEVRNPSLDLLRSRTTEDLRFTIRICILFT